MRTSIGATAVLDVAAAASSTHATQSKFERTG